MGDSDLTAFGQRLKEKRVQLGYTQPELADVLSVKRQTISSWEQGITAPDIQKLLLLKNSAAREGHAFNLGELVGESAEDGEGSPLRFALDLLTTVDEMGLRGLYHNRGEALEAFIPALKREQQTISVVSSSFLGVLRVASAQVSDLLREKAKSVPDFRILMTEPKAMGSLRESQEGRSKGSIEKEIADSVAKLLDDWRVDAKSIRFYRGAPTVFLLATSERMLLNPYTYQTEAFKTVTLQVARTGNRDDIFSQYRDNHFVRPWESENSIPCTIAPQKRE